MTLSPSSKGQNRTRCHGRRNDTEPARLREGVQENPDKETEPSPDHHKEFMAHIRESFERNHQLYELLSE